MIPRAAAHTIRVLLLGLPLGVTSVLPIGLFLGSGCGGSGGGGGGSFDSSAQLEAVAFPDPNGVNPEPEDSPPGAAPLVQQVVLTFSGNPDPNRVSANSVPIRDASGLSVAGRYVVDGRIVTFTPTLPLRPLVVAGNGAIDTGGAGLVPGGTYTLRIGPRTCSFMTGAAAALLARFPDPIDPGGIVVGFQATTNVADFFAGLPIGAPQVVAADPIDGATGVSPNLYADPDGLFAPRRPFLVTFDRPLNPDLANVSDATFALVDLDDRPGGFPAGLPLGIDVTLLENEVDRSVVQVTPSGILPFGHLLALEYPAALKSLSEPAAPTPATSVATTFTVAAAPATTVHDLLFEDFDTTARQETDVAQVGTGNLPAEWDVRDSDVLLAGFEFQGDGILGEFKPPTPPDGVTRVVTLDTTRQTFPLPDGSTPNAPPGFEVRGGVFPFTDIDIPDGVVIKPLGNNPLVLTATGSVHLAGDVIVAGEDGTPENAYDSAVTSLPGGAGIGGGGRGGEAHPILFFPPDQISYLTLVSPLFGGTGFGIDPADGVMKRIGGTGGQCGILDLPDGSGKYSTDQEMTECTEFRVIDNNQKVPGGGGGSLFGAGDAPRDNNAKPLHGIGNVIPDGTGSFTPRVDTRLLCGNGGLPPFFSDGDAGNDFYGTKGQLTRLIGGQGGGGGASLTESYYCGKWCRYDANPANDKCCCGSSATCDPFAWNGTRAGSVGDARGGGGGAGGGAVLIQALGSIGLDPTCLIDAHGGNGMGGEGLGCSYWGGGGGGGGGGLVVLQSGTSIVVQAGAVINVKRGFGDDAADGNDAYSCDDGGSDGAIGDGGPGGDGLIQLQVPAGSTATVVAALSSLIPFSSWIDPTNTQNPVEFTPVSVALSKWFDLGRVTQRAPADTNPLFTFGGLDAFGYVVTDASGNVASPATTDLVAGYLGQIDPITKQYRPGEQPQADFIPPNATIRMEFQGADPIVPGSKEVDPATLTPWSGSASIADGMQFLRWRLTFDLTADGSQLAPDTRRPVVQSVQVHAGF